MWYWMTPCSCWSRQSTTPPCQTLPSLLQPPSHLALSVIELDVSNAWKVPMDAKIAFIHLHSWMNNPFYRQQIGHSSFVFWLFVFVFFVFFLTIEWLGIDGSVYVWPKRLGADRDVRHYRRRRDVIWHPHPSYQLILQVLPLFSRFFLFFTKFLFDKDTPSVMRITSWKRIVFEMSIA